MSCSWKSKPDEVPSSGTAGGITANTMASRIWPNTPMARPATTPAFRLAALRSSKSLRRTKARPAFWPAPLKLKPETVNTDCTASFSSIRKWSRTLSSTPRVFSWVAPAGSWTRVIMIPWSSSGRKALGRRTNSRPMTRMIAP